MSKLIVEATDVSELISMLPQVSCSNPLAERPGSLPVWRE